MNWRMTVALAAAAAFASGALAQEPENPLPLGGGAIVYADPDKKDAPLPDPLNAGWRGEKVCEKLHENNRVRTLRCTFPPGVGHEKHFHPPHWGYILQGGKMQITDEKGTREQDTPAGASWWSDGVAWHEAVNIGDTTTVYIIVEPKRNDK